MNSFGNQPNPLCLTALLSVANMTVHLYFPLPTLSWHLLLQLPAHCSCPAISFHETLEVPTSEQRTSLSSSLHLWPYWPLPDFAPGWPFPKCSHVIASPSYATLTLQGLDVVWLLPFRPLHLPGISFHPLRLLVTISFPLHDSISNSSPKSPLPIHSPLE